MALLAAFKAYSLTTFFVVMLSKTNYAFFSNEILKAIFRNVTFLSASETFDDPIFFLFLFDFMEISEGVHLW